MTITPSIDPLMSGLLKAICAEMQMAINKNNQKEGFNKLPIVNKLFNNTNVDKSMFWIISTLIEVEAIVFSRVVLNKNMILVRNSALKGLVQ